MHKITRAFGDLSADKIMLDDKFHVKIGNIEGLKEIHSKTEEKVKADLFAQDLAKVVEIAKSLGQCHKEFKLEEGNDVMDALPAALRDFIKAC